MMQILSNLAKSVYRRVRSVTSIQRLPRWFWNDLTEYNSRCDGSLIKNPARRSDLYPILNERTSAVEFDPHYVYHVAWAARILARTRPSHHVDFGSLSHFVTVCSAFMPITHYDYRTPEFNVDGLENDNADLTALPMGDGVFASVSCMHVIEHIGLGRYGDMVDPDGDRKAIQELQRVIAPGGQLLFVVPVGKERVMFNAHRVYGYDTIVDAFNEMELKEFSLISMRGKARLIRNAAPLLVENED